MAAWQEFLKTCSSKSSKSQSFHLPELQPRSRLFCGPCSVDVPELLSLLHITPNLIKQQHIALLRSPTGGRKEEWTSLRAMLPRAAAGRPEWLAGSWLGAITPWRWHLTVPGSWAGTAGRSINIWSGRLMVRQPKCVTLHVYPLVYWHKNCIYLVAHCAFFVKVFFFLLMWTISKVFIEYVTILFLLFSGLVLVFWPWGLWDLSFLTRDWTWTPCIGRWSLNHCTSREGP